MFKTHGWSRTLAAALVAACALLARPADALADKLYLKDGRILEGEVIKKSGSFVYFKVKGKEKEELFDMAAISKVLDDEDPPAAPPAATPNATPPPSPSTSNPKTDSGTKPEAKPEAKPDPKTNPAAPGKSASRIPRIAILNFGPPTAWQGAIGDTVGTVISAKSWRDAIPLLERDKVTDVVVRINSGGGYLAELEPFHELYEKDYKSRFRTVAWVESAISAAAMSPYPIEEFYFMPSGTLGACTGFRGAYEAVKGVELEEYIIAMERASRLGNRSPFIMKAMQVSVPLSCNIDDQTGAVTWFQDLSGAYIVNPGEKILTLTANEAVKFRFAKAIAATQDDLARAMGYTEWEWAGKQAARSIDDHLRANDANSKRFTHYFDLYQINLEAAQALPEGTTPRRAQVGIARKHLEEMKKAVRINPNIGTINGVPADWFTEQDELLKDLLK